MANEPTARTRFIRRVLPRLSVSLAIAAGFVWVLQRGGLPFAAPAGGMDELSWAGLSLYAALMLFATFARTGRWFYLLQPLSPGLRRWRVFGAALVGAAAVFLAPLRLGEVVRPYTLSRDGQVTFAQAIGTVAAERVIDGLAVVGLAALSLALSTPLAPLPARVGALPIPVSLVSGTIVAASVMFGLAFAAMTLFYVARERARRLVEAVVGVVSKRLAAFCSGFVERLADGLGFLPSWQRSAPFLRDTALYWLSLGAAQYVLLRSLGLPSSFAEAFVTLGVISLGSLLPAGPGFFGAYQVAAYTSLAMFNAEHDVLTKGAAFVFISYVTQVVLNLGSGVVGLILLTRVPPGPRSAETAAT